jgi:glycerol kinase
MTKGYILALDQSTSGSKAMIVNRDGRILEKTSLEHKQYYPRPGWVEHDPIEIYENVKNILTKVLENAKLHAEDMDVLSITNQRETILVWDRNTGMPVYNAIVWQCRRTSEFCQELKNEGYELIIQQKTGLIIDPYFSATKVKWILDNVEGVREKADSGKLLLGTIDSWLVWKLTGGETHVTDYTNASRTLLFNIHTLQWDNELLALFDIPSSMLPAIKSSNDIVGYTSQNEIFDVSLPISGLIGDSQGALFGQNCFEIGMVKATYGTGSSIMMNIGDRFVGAGNGLVTSVAWGVNGKVEYALEGIVHCTGDALKWVKDNLGLFDDFKEAERMVSSIDNNEGVYMVPAFVGLGVPYWDPDARAAVVGMSRSSRKEHIVRAAIESTAYQIMDAINMMESESGIGPKELRVDGGPTKNVFLMQFQADILNLCVVCTENPELSAMGSAYLAGLAIGVWKDKEEIRNLRKETHIYYPSMPYELRKCYCREWKVAVKKVLTR